MLAGDVRKIWIMILTLNTHSNKSKDSAMHVKLDLLFVLHDKIPLLDYAQSKT